MLRVAMSGVLEHRLARVAACDPLKIDAPDVVQTVSHFNASCVSGCSKPHRFVARAQRPVITRPPGQSSQSHSF
jgi:hypothetical protein